MMNDYWMEFIDKDKSFNVEFLGHSTLAAGIFFPWRDAKILPFKCNEQMFNRWHGCNHLCAWANTQYQKHGRICFLFVKLISISSTNAATIKV